MALYRRPWQPSQLRRLDLGQAPISEAQLEYLPVELPQQQPVDLGPLPMGSPLANWQRFFEAVGQGRPYETRIFWTWVAVIGVGVVLLVAHKEGKAAGGHAKI